MLIYVLLTMQWMYFRKLHTLYIIIYKNYINSKMVNFYTDCLICTVLKLLSFLRNKYIKLSKRLLLFLNTIKSKSKRK